MTDEEINRKFDVVADHLASLAVGLQSLQGEVRSLAQAQQRAEKRWATTEESVRAMLAISEVQAQEITQLAESIKAVDERQREADERGRQTDERLNALINIIERIISERRDGDRGKE